MIQELWNSFPQLIVEKVNHLLDEAEPNPMKAFQLYKTCQTENLWQESFEKFAQHLEAYFALPKKERRKSRLDSFLDRPMGMEIFEQFHLTFRNALVNNKDLNDIANWAHHLMRVGHKTNSAVISEEVFAKTLRYITNPPHFVKDSYIEFDDFCEAWKKVVFTLFGRKYDGEFKSLLNELHLMNKQLCEAEQHSQARGVFPTIYLTQTEIDWTLAVQKAAQELLPMPKFPLSRGPQKERLIELERSVNLYKIVQTSKLPEFIKHRENIRATILDRCESLLRERAS